MERNTTVLSRAGTKQIIPKLKYYNWISIRDPYQDSLQSLNRDIFIDLVFFDDGHSFTKDQARQIYEWLKTCDLDKELIINCHAGISRSAAVASAIEETIYKNRDHNYFVQKVPNSYVYKTMLEIYHTEYTSLDYINYLVNKTEK